VLVKLADSVQPDQVVAQAKLPGILQNIKMAERLGCASRLTEAVAEIFARAVETGHGGRNVSHLLDPAIDDVT
jgi:hypothetical protein